MLVKDMDKLQFGTYIKFREQLYIIVGMQNYYLYVYKCKAVREIKSYELQYLYVSYSDLDKYELVEQTQEEDREVLYTKLLLMTDKEDRDKICFFKPFNMIDITKNDVDITNGILDTNMYDDISLFATLQKMQYKDANIILHIDKIVDIMQKKCGLLLYADISLYVCDKGYYITRKQYKTYALYQYMHGKPYQVKGKMTKEFVIEDYSSEFNSYLERIQYEDEMPDLYYKSQLDAVVYNLSENFCNHVLCDKMYLLYKETGTKKRVKGRLKWSEMKKLRKVVNQVRIEHNESKKVVQ